MLAAGSWVAWREHRRQKLISDAATVWQLYQQADYPAAEALANRLLQHMSAGAERDQVQLLAAKSAMEQGRAEEALGYLNHASVSSEQSQLESSLLKADLLHYQLYRWRDAEDAYLNALNLSPQSVVAREELVRLLAICGRRREAMPHLRILVQQQQASDLLIIAARATGSVNDPDLLQTAAARSPDDAAVLLARALQASRADNLAAAIEFCRTAIAADPNLIVAHVALGQYLLESHDFGQLEIWNRKLPTAAGEFAEAWQVRAALAEHLGDTQHALHLYLEAARRGPDLKQVFYRLSRLLQPEYQQHAQEFENYLKLTQHLEVLQDRMFSDAAADPDALIECIDGFQSLGRIWEACGWAQLGLAMWPDDRTLQEKYVHLQHSVDASSGVIFEPWIAAMDNMAAQLRTDAAAAASERDSFAAQNLADGGSASAVNDPSDQHAAAMRHRESRSSDPDDGPVNDRPPQPRFAFRNDALAAGLNFEFLNGVSGNPRRMMYEFTGGGIAVVDFDHDQYPDVLLAQGLEHGPWPDGRAAANPDDVLFRNQRGEHFVNCAAQAGITDHFFGQGVAAGDINNDGFVDLVIGNIGSNSLWLNLGDGTFENATTLLSTAPELSPGPGLQPATGLSPAPPRQAWTTGVMIGDLDGDGGPDIYVCNYLQGEDVFERVCQNAQGEPRACIPVHFDAAPDELYFNALDGTLVDASDQLNGIEPGKGLGLLAFSSGTDATLSLMVANDTTPNMLLRFERTANPVVVDNGFSTGLALNVAGKAEGCMGIAAADVNADGRPDLFVTNFFNETNTLYVSTGNRMFDDQTATSGLAEPSRRMLGFGTQFLDIDLDSNMELFVTNGHVDDLTSEGKPNHMPAQFFHSTDGFFSEAPVESHDGYLSNDHLGRSVALLDWNRDGLPDLLIGHLYEPYALLTNTTEPRGNGIALKLIGTQSARDAVGATVTWTLNGDSGSCQLTGGSGYMASNQPILWLGCDQRDQLEELTVRWPSGIIQTFPRIEANRELTIVEGRSAIYATSR